MDEEIDEFALADKLYEEEKKKKSK